MQISFGNIFIKTNTKRENDAFRDCLSYQQNVLKTIPNDVVQISFGCNSKNLISLGDIIKNSRLKSFNNINLSKAYEANMLTSKDLINITESYAGKFPKYLKYFVDNKIPLTKYDLDYPEILEERFYYFNSTILESTSDSYIKQKERILANEIAKMEEIPCDRKITIITGLAGAGKSTIYKK